MTPFIICQAQGSDAADEWTKLGVDAHARSDFPNAEARYRQALRLNPRHHLAQQNLAIVFAQTNRVNDGLLAIRRAAMIEPGFSIIRVNAALMHLQADRIDQALDNARQAVQMQPDIGSWTTLALILATAGLPGEAVPLYNKILDQEPKHPAAGPNACFVQTLTDATPAELLKQRRRWYDANRYEGAKSPHDNDRTPGRVLRVGYVGGDFKSHSAAFIFKNVLLHHTPAVEMYLYSSLPVDPTQDGATKRFQKAAGDRWRDITALPDEEVDRLIRRDRIDILVDLAAHTNGGRLALFTRKPAPIQVTAWGFAHGTGCPEIDYFFADPVAVPEQERGDFAEKIWDLPCVVTMEEPQDYNLNGTSRAPMHANGYFTFGSYARYEKMSDDCLKTFAEILRRVPESRIQFKDASYTRPYSIERINKMMPDIAENRFLFSMATSHQEHLQAYQQADLMLDPFPHTGGVVCLEALWMGVPIVTRYGTQPSGRTTSSVLTVIGRQDWIARTSEEYIEIAVRLANDPGPLFAARKTLRQELVESPVIKDYALRVEEAYKAMFARWSKS